MLQKYNVGIIGYGGMGHWHRNNIANVQNLNIAGIYDINPQKIELAVSEGLKGYRSLEELLSDQSIDIVIIATPNNFHKELCTTALEAGKNVICEKPVMMNSADLIEVMDIAKKSGKLFSVHQNRRWDKDFRIVKNAIENNLIGTPFYIESRVQGSRGIPGDWRCVKEAGGGMLLDWGIHLIDQIMWLVDSPVTEVYTHLLSIKFPDIDDNFKLLLKFENGISALIEVDTYCFINLPRWHISGDGGTLVIDDWDCKGKILKANTVEFKWEQGIVYTSAGPTKTMAPRPVETIDELPLPIENPDCADYYRNFIAALESREELIVKPEQCLKVMQVIDATFLSAKEGICVRMK